MGTEPQKRPDLIPLAYECLHRLHICPLFVTMPNQNQQEPYQQALLPGTPRGFDQTCLHRRREEEVGGEDKNNFCFLVTRVLFPSPFQNRPASFLNPPLDSGKFLLRPLLTHHVCQTSPWVTWSPNTLVRGTVHLPCRMSPIVCSGSL